MVVSVDTESALVVGQPRVLFGGPYRATGGPSRFFDLFPDGERLVMVQIGSASGREEFHVVENWFQELERLVPTP